MTIADVLDTAADLIEPEGAFDPGPFAKNAEGEEVHPNADDAVCFCGSGATWRAATNLGLTLVDRNQADKFFGEHAGEDLPYFALHHTQPEVVAKLREAAAKAREQGL